MKRVLLIIICSLLYCWAHGQSREITLDSSGDYSAFFQETGDWRCELQGVASNDFYTGVFMRITVTNRYGGEFVIPKTAFIAGPFGTMNPIGVTIGGRDWSLDKVWDYDRGNKGKHVDIVVFFNRIPAGVKRIKYCEPDFLSWENIPVAGNEDPVVHTQWDEYSLREYWDKNGCSNIEGIYYFTTTSDKKWWGTNKHTLAVIKDGYQYNIIYLKGSNKNIWKEGDLKACFIATATPGLYKATSWYMENRLENEDFYIKFTDGSMSIYENTASVTADFLKLYPANDINTRSSSSISNGNSATNVTSHKSSGSGIFIAPKIIATNNHVIDGAKKIEVVIKTGNNLMTYVAKSIAIDKYNDLALISIDDPKFEGIDSSLPYRLLGRTLDVGTSVFTMGYPLANYMGEEVKITDGIISSKTGFEGDIVTYQISAPIQPGSSGGPLFDKNGNLIGITNAGISAAQNVGYAIKSSYLCNLIESAPISIPIPEQNQLTGMDLTEQIKLLSKYVVYIRIY